MLKSQGWIAVLVFAVCSRASLAALQRVARPRTDSPAWKSNYCVGVPSPGRRHRVLLPIYVQGLRLHVPILTPLVLIYTLGIAL